MTAPAPDEDHLDGPAPVDPAPAKGKRASTLQAGVVVDFRHDDPVTGGTVEGLGVVLWAGGDNEAALIAPCLSSYLQVDPANVTPVTFD